MSKETIPTQFKNPCKYCLVKPTCQKKCILLDNHIALFDTVWVLFMVALTIGFLVITSIIIYLYTSLTTTLISISAYIITIYFITFIFFIKNPSDFKTLEKNEIMIIMITLPILIITSFLVSKTERIMVKIGRYLFRYHPTIDPNKFRY